MNTKQSRLAKLGKAILDNPNFEFDLHQMMSKVDQGRHKVDRLKQLSDQFAREDQQQRQKRQLKARLNIQKQQNEQMKRLFEERIMQSEKNIIQYNRDVATVLKQQLDSIKERQVMMEEFVKRPNYYPSNQNLWAQRQNFQQPVYVYPRPIEAYQPEEQLQRPKKGIRRYQSGPVKGSSSGDTQRLISEPEPQQPEQERSQIAKMTRSSISKPLVNQQKLRSLSKFNAPQQQKIVAAQKSVYSQISRKSIKSNSSKNKVNSVSQPIPVAKPPRPTTRRVRKYMLAVWYLALIKKQIRNKIFRRKLKSETYFNNIYSNTLRFVGSSFHKLIEDIQKKMMSFEDKSAEFLATPQCYDQVQKLMKMFMDKLPQAKDILVKDKTSLSLMKFLFRPNQFIPSLYLTQYELSKVLFSLSFGFLYKNEQIKAFLLSTFLLMRCVMLHTFCQSLSFDIMFTKNQVVGEMLRHLTNGLYELFRSVIQEYRQQVKEKGNWDQLPTQLAYTPAQAVTKEVEEFCKGWDEQLQQYLKSNKDAWASMQFRVKQWIEDIKSVVNQHANSELSFYRTAKSKKLTNGSLKNIKT